MKKTLFFVFIVSMIGSVIFAYAETEVQFVDGIRIVYPVNGTQVTPGQTISFRVEEQPGFKPAVISVVSPFFMNEYKQLPAVFDVTIPEDAIGNIKIGVIAFDVSDGPANKIDNEFITLPVVLNATLQDIQVEPDEFRFEVDWNDNIADISNTYGFAEINGVYSDGVSRDIYKIPGLQFQSSNETIASVDSKGKVTAHKLGEVKIVVSYEGVNKEVPVVFRKPTGLRPEETVPPIVTVDIKPTSNSIGWHNQDLTITIMAQDDSGIQEIDWRFPNLQGKYDFVKSGTAVITFSNEGDYDFWYFARDNELNKTDGELKVRLDKTPPAVSITAEPAELWPPNGKLVDVKIIGKANDALSGVDKVVFTVVDEYGKCQPVINGFGSMIRLEAQRDGNDKDGRLYTISATAYDKAGNQKTVSTTVICPHDQGKGKKK